MIAINRFTSECVAFRCNCCNLQHLLPVQTINSEYVAELERRLSELEGKAKTLDELNQLNFLLVV